MHVNKTPIEDYVRRIEDGRHFSLVRYGDGEFYAILGYDGQNCDGHKYYPELGADLADTLRNPRPYMHAIGPMATKHAHIRTWIQDHSKVPSWHSTEVFPEASIEGKLGPLTRALSEKRTLYVGPPHLAVDSATVAGMFRHCHYVPIPAVNVYLVKEILLTRIRTAIDLYQPDIVGFSAGMTTNILIYELFRQYDTNLTMIDFGSVWDVYAGKISRSYQRGINVRRMREANTAT